MTSEADKWQKRYEREKLARIQAEALLEEKSSQLYDAKSQLEKEIVIETSKLRQEEEKFTALFHSSIDGIVLSSPDDTIINANQTICDLLKVDAAQLIGTKLISHHLENSRPETQRELNKVIENGFARYECVFKRFNNTLMPAEVSASKFTVNDQTIIQTIIRDTTKRNKIEFEIKQATDEAIRANEAKSLFLATMSHEIRTPLNGIIGFTDILLQEKHSEEQSEHLNIIKKSGTILLNIINDILDFSRVENREIELEQVDFSLSECIEETLTIHAQKADSKSVALLYNIEPSTPTELHGDVGRLRQILMNLVSNSLKFTDEGNITIRASQPSPETIKIKVIDTGIGFEPDIASQLFNPFQQADASTTRKYGGTGLGLSICKRLIEIMGGSISADSTPGQGATFSITLPYIAAKSPLPSLKDTYNVDQLKGKQILVIDNHEENLKLMASHLQPWGCIVTTESCAAAALKQIVTNTVSYDMIFTDLTVEDMDGYQLADKVMNHLGAKTPPLILTSASHGSNDKRKALKQGFNTLLHKPIREKELLTTICKALNISYIDSNQPLTAAKKRPSNQSSSELKFFALVVEDNFINAKLAQMILERLGISAHVAHNGKEALETLQTKDIYDIIFMDMQMPVMDGIEASQKIRDGEAKDIYKDIPIIAMTANTQPEDKERCVNAGMNQFITKPINAPEIEKTLEHYHLIESNSQAN